MKRIKILALLLVLLKVVCADYMFENFFMEKEQVPIEKEEVESILDRLTPKKVISLKKDINDLILVCEKKELYFVNIYLQFNLGKILLDDNQIGGLPYVMSALNVFDTYAKGQEDIEQKVRDNHLAAYKYLITYSTADEKKFALLLRLLQKRSESLLWGNVRNIVVTKLLLVSIELAFSSQKSHLRYLKKCDEIVRSYQEIFVDKQRIQELRSEFLTRLQKNFNVNNNIFQKTQSLMVGKRALEQAQILMFYQHDVAKIYYNLKQQIQEREASIISKYSIFYFAIILIIWISLYYYTRVIKKNYDFDGSVLVNDTIGVIIQKYKISTWGVFAIFYFMNAVVVVLWNFYNGTFCHPIESNHPIVSYFGQFINQYSCHRDITTFCEDFSGALNYLVIAPLGCTLVYFFYNVMTRHTELIRNGMIYKQSEEVKTIIQRFYEVFTNRNLPRIAGLMALVVCYVVAQRKIGIWCGIAEGGIGFYTRYFLSFVNYTVLSVFCIKILVFVYFQLKLSRCELAVNPFHRDRCGGMSTFGKLGLAANLILCLFGFFLIMNVGKAAGMEYENFTTWLCVVLYLILTPIIFLYPILSVRKKMKAKRESQIQKLELHLHEKYHQIDDSFDGAKIENFNLCRELYENLQKFPTWPLNAKILIQVLSTYLIPLAIFLFNLIFIDGFDFSVLGFGN